MSCDGEVDCSSESELTKGETEAVRSFRVFDEEERKALDSKILFYMWERAVRGCLRKSEESECLEGLHFSNQRKAGPSLWWDAT